jgi:hypothetical protein
MSGALGLKADQTGSTIPKQALEAHMRRISSTLLVFLVVVLPAAAEEIVLKDGTKIVGRMTAITGDKIEIESAYGKMAFKRTDIVTINFPENGAGPAPDASAKKDTSAPNIEESLRGNQYVNKTGKFALTLPQGWRIDPNLGHSQAMLAGLSSSDEMRFLTVTQEQFNASLEGYKGLLEFKYRKTFGGYEEISQSAVTIDGKPALLISFRGTLPQAGLPPVQYLVAIIPSGTTFTRVATWCAEPLFHETQPTFEKILSSFHYTEQASPTAQASRH